MPSIHGIQTFNKERAELKTFVNKDTVDWHMMESTECIPDRGAGQFFVTKLSKLEPSGVGDNRNNVLIYSNRKAALALIHRCEKFHACS